MRSLNLSNGLNTQINFTYKEINKLAEEKYPDLTFEEQLSSWLYEWIFEGNIDGYGNTSLYYLDKAKNDYTLLYKQNYKISSVKNRDNINNVINLLIIENKFNTLYKKEESIIVNSTLTNKYIDWIEREKNLVKPIFVEPCEDELFKWKSKSKITSNFFNYEIKTTDISKKLYEDLEYNYNLLYELDNISHDILSDFNKDIKKISEMVLIELNNTNTSNRKFTGDNLSELLTFNPDVKVYSFNPVNINYYPTLSTGHEQYIKSFNEHIDYNGLIHLNFLALSNIYSFKSFKNEKYYSNFNLSNQSMFSRIDNTRFYVDEKNPLKYIDFNVLANDYSDNQNEYSIFFTNEDLKNKIKYEGSLNVNFIENFLNYNFSLKRASNPIIGYHAMRDSNYDNYQFILTSSEVECVNVFNKILRTNSNYLTSQKLVIYPKFLLENYVINNFKKEGVFILNSIITDGFTHVNYNSSSYFKQYDLFNSNFVLGNRVQSNNGDFFTHEMHNLFSVTLSQPSVNVRIYTSPGAYGNISKYTNYKYSVKELNNFKSLFFNLLIPNKTVLNNFGLNVCDFLALKLNNNVEPNIRTFEDRTEYYITGRREDGVQVDQIILTKYKNYCTFPLTLIAEDQQFEGNAESFYRLYEVNAIFYFEEAKQSIDIVKTEDLYNITIKNTKNETITSNIKNKFVLSPNKIYNIGLEKIQGLFANENNPKILSIKLASTDVKYAPFIKKTDYNNYEIFTNGYTPEELTKSYKYILHFIDSFGLAKSIEFYIGVKDDLYKELPLLDTKSNTNIKKVLDEESDIEIIYEDSKESIITIELADEETGEVTEKNTSEEIVLSKSNLSFNLTLKDITNCLNESSNTLYYLPYTCLINYDDYNSSEFVIESCKYNYYFDDSEEIPFINVTLTINGYNKNNVLEIPITLQYLTSNGLSNIKTKLYLGTENAFSAYEPIEIEDTEENISTFGLTRDIDDILNNEILISCENIFEFNSSIKIKHGKINQDSHDEIKVYDETPFDISSNSSCVSNSNKNYIKYNFETNGFYISLLQDSFIDNIFNDNCILQIKTEDNKIDLELSFDFSIYKSNFINHNTNKIYNVIKSDSIKFNYARINNKNCNISTYLNNRNDYELIDKKLTIKKQKQNEVIVTIYDNRTTQFIDLIFNLNSFDKLLNNITVTDVESHKTDLYINKFEDTGRTKFYRINDNTKKDDLLFVKTLKINYNTPYKFYFNRSFLENIYIEVYNKLFPGIKYNGNYENIEKYTELNISFKEFISPNLNENGEYNLKSNTKHIFRGTADTGFYLDLKNNICEPIYDMTVEINFTDMSSMYTPKVIFVIEYDFYNKARLNDIVYKICNNISINFYEDYLSKFLQNEYWDNLLPKFWMRCNLNGISSVDYISKKPILSNNKFYTFENKIIPIINNYWWLFGEDYIDENSFTLNNAIFPLEWYPYDISDNNLHYYEYENEKIFSNKSNMFLLAYLLHYINLYKLQQLGWTKSVHQNNVLFDVVKLFNYKNDKIYENIILNNEQIEFNNIELLTVGYDFDINKILQSNVRNGAIHSGIDGLMSEIKSSYIVNTTTVNYLDYIDENIDTLLEYWNNRLESYELIEDILNNCKLEDSFFEYGKEILDFLYARYVNSKNTEHIKWTKNYYLKLQQIDALSNDITFNYKTDMDMSPYYTKLWNILFNGIINSDDIEEHILETLRTQGIRRYYKYVNYKTKYSIDNNGNLIKINVENFINTEFEITEDNLEVQLLNTNEETNQIEYSKVNKTIHNGKVIDYFINEIYIINEIRQTNKIKGLNYSYNVFPSFDYVYDNKDNLPEYSYIYKEVLVGGVLGQGQSYLIPEESGQHYTINSKAQIEPTDAKFEYGTFEYKPPLSYSSNASGRIVMNIEHKLMKQISINKEKYNIESYTLIDDYLYEYSKSDILLGIILQKYIIKLFINEFRKGFILLKSIDKYFKYINNFNQLESLKGLEISWPDLSIDLNDSTIDFNSILPILHNDVLTENKYSIVNIYDLLGIDKLNEVSIEKLKILKENYNELYQQTGGESSHELQRLSYSILNVEQFISDTTTIKDINLVLNKNLDDKFKDKYFEFVNKKYNNFIGPLQKTFNDAINKGGYDKLKETPLGQYCYLNEIKNVFNNNSSGLAYLLYFPNSYSNILTNDIIDNVSEIINNDYKEHNFVDLSENYYLSCSYFANIKLHDIETNNEFIIPGTTSLMTYITYNVNYVYEDGTDLYTSGKNIMPLELNFPLEVGYVSEIRTERNIVSDNYVLRQIDNNNSSYFKDCNPEYIANTTNDKSLYYTYTTHISVTKNVNNDQFTYVTNLELYSYNIDISIKLPEYIDNPSATVEIRKTVAPDNKLHNDISYLWITPTNKKLEPFGVLITNGYEESVQYHSNYIDNKDILNLSYYTDIQNFSACDYNGGNKNSEALDLYYKLKNTKNISYAAYLCMNYNNLLFNDYSNIVENIKPNQIVEDQNKLRFSLFKYYLGSITEWELIIDNLYKVNEKISELNGDVFYDGILTNKRNNNLWYWSSSEEDDTKAWDVFFTQSVFNHKSKVWFKNIRPFFNIKQLGAFDKHYDFIFNFIKTDKSGLSLNTEELDNTKDNFGLFNLWYTKINSQSMIVTDNLVMPQIIRPKEIVGNSINDNNTNINNFDKLYSIEKIVNLNLFKNADDADEETKNKNKISLNINFNQCYKPIFNNIFINVVIFPILKKKNNISQNIILDYTTGFTKYNSNEPKNESEKIYNKLKYDKKIFGETSESDIFYKRYNITDKIKSEIYYEKEGGPYLVFNDKSSQYFANLVNILLDFNTPIFNKTFSLTEFLEDKSILNKIFDIEYSIKEGELIDSFGICLFTGCHNEYDFEFINKTRYNNISNGDYDFNENELSYSYIIIDDDINDQKQYSEYIENFDYIKHNLFMMNNKQIDVNNNVLFNYYNIPISQIDNFKYSFKNENNLKLDFSNLNMINKRLHNKLYAQLVVNPNLPVIGPNWNNNLNQVTPKV